MADIYLYVPCNGTRYYTSPDVTSSEFVVYGGCVTRDVGAGNVALFWEVKGYIS